VKWVIYISTFFIIAYLLLKNPSGYQAGMGAFSRWFNKSFSAFGRVAQ